MEKFRYLITIILSLLFNDLNCFQYTKNYLISESQIISSFINLNCGVSSDLMNYLYDKNYTFIYDENNLDQFGNIVYYSLKMDCYSLIIDKKEIIIKQCVLLSH